MLAIYQQSLSGSEAARVLDTVITNRLRNIPWDDVIVTAGLKTDEMMAQAKMLFAS
jgi:hypothetical protein